MMFSDSEMHSTMSNENGFVLTQMKASRGSSWFVCLQRLLEVVITLRMKTMLIVVIVLLTI